jgi:hypothetical protein
LIGVMGRDFSARALAAERMTLLSVIQRSAKLLLWMTTEKGSFTMFGAAGLGLSG